MKVLVVEDSPDSRDLIAHGLAKAGVTDIDYAENGKDAVDALAKEKPDLIILDLIMPEKSGLEFLDDISRQQLQSKILVVSSDEMKSMSAITMGADASLSKPFKPDELVELINELMPS